MSGVNSDIQASHQLISLLERSKDLSDEFMDDLPGLFLIIDESGRVLRGNRRTAELIGCRLESLLDQKLKDYFSPQNWTNFRSHCLAVSTGVLNYAEFEMSLDHLPDSEDTTTTEPPVFAWRIQPFQAKEKTRQIPVLSIIAHDLTELRQKERELAEFFTSVPIGILTVLADGIIDPRYSTYTAYLLGIQELAGRSLMEVLIEPAAASLGKSGKDVFENLIGLIGTSAKNFDMIWDMIPKEIKITISGDSGAPEDRYIGLTFQKVSDENGHVQKLMVLLENQTARVLQRLKEQEERQKFEVNSIRISQIRSCSPDILEIGMDEGGPLVQQLQSSLKKKEATNILNRLHSLKGVTRILNFDTLKNAAHQLEIQLKEQLGKRGGIDWNDTTAKIQNIIDEWSEMSGLYDALILKKSRANEDSKAQKSGPTESSDHRILAPQETKRLFDRLATTLMLPESIHRFTQSERLRLTIQSLNRSPLKIIENSIQAKARETGRQLKKEFQLECHLDQIWIEDEVASSLSEILLHLITNSLSHGIESPEVRTAKDKSASGTISLKMREEHGRVFGVLSDDGAGLNLERIKLTAIRNGMLTLESASQLSDDDASQLIFERNFSTAEKLTDISGQGIGLDVVRTNLRQMEGGIHVQARTPHGIEFHFDFLPCRPETWNRRCFFIEGLSERLQADSLLLLQREGLAECIQWQGSQSEPGIIIADPERFVLSASTLLMNEICALRPEKISAQVTASKDHLELQLTTSTHPESRSIHNHIPPEFQLTLPWGCSAIERSGGARIRSAHLFNWKQEGTQWRATLPLARIYRPQQLPSLQIKVLRSKDALKNSERNRALQAFLNRVGVQGILIELENESFDETSLSELNLSHEAQIGIEGWAPGTHESELLRDVLSQRLSLLLGLT